MCYTYHTELLTQTQISWLISPYREMMLFTSYIKSESENDKV